MGLDVIYQVVVFLLFQCIYCSSKFPHSDYLVRHLQENIMKLIQCPVCSLTSQLKSTVLAHIAGKMFVQHSCLCNKSIFNKFPITYKYKVDQ